MLAKISNKGKIERTREGVMLPERNAFDFTVLPRKQEVAVKSNKEKSGREKLKKSLLQMKRKNA